MQTMLLSAVMHTMILRAGVRDGALLVSGSSRICDVVIMSRASAVVHMFVLVFLGDMEGQVVTRGDTLLGRRVVLVHVGHGENGHKTNSYQRR
jgi:hypothetical protein